jgi:hypothetical protein
VHRNGASITPRYYPRVSNETPSCRAFCRIAPTVRLNRLANWGADRFARANFLNSRTSVDFHARRFSFFKILATTTPAKIMPRHTTRIRAALVKSLQINSLWLTKCSELLFDTRWACIFYNLDRLWPSSDRKTRHQSAMDWLRASLSRRLSKMSVGEYSNLISLF